MKTLQKTIEDLEQENKKLLDKISLLKVDYLALESEYFAKLDELERENQKIALDARRYTAIKEKIEYFQGYDGMTWATLNWCVDIHSLSPTDLNEAIDKILLANLKK